MAVFAGVQINPIAGKEHFDRGIVRGGGKGRIRTEAQAGEKFHTGSRRSEPYFPGEVTLGFEKKEPKHQVSQTTAAMGGQDADFSQPVGAGIPPDPPGSGRNAFLINHDIPAEVIQRIPTVLKNVGADEVSFRCVRAGGKPFSLNHAKNSFAKRGGKMDAKKIERINELARKKKAEGLTEAETKEQAILREEYLAGYRENLKAMLDNIIVQEKDGTRHPLRKKPAGE